MTVLTVQHYKLLCNKIVVRFGHEVADGVQLM